MDHNKIIGYLALQARSKLAKEVRKEDHDLRVLVGHAILFDKLLDSLKQLHQPAKEEDKHEYNHKWD